MKIIGAQGELRIYKIDKLPDDIGSKRPARGSSGFILAHSEKGHHHVLDGNVDVIEHVKSIKIDSGNYAMRTLYAIVKEPTALKQTALDKHADIPLNTGIYVIRADVEFNPFEKQLQEVRD